MLQNIKKKVRHELIWHPETRNNDRLLIAHIYAQYGVTSQPFDEVVMREDLPNFESIRRCRAKIQEQEPDLRAVEKVEQMRLDMQKEYLDFVREA